MNTFLTIFTPTYNRANEIVGLYKSLREQTMFDFEWIIVDDGSTDNTELIIDKFKKECDLFSINYYKQENQGKHSAINRGVKLAKGKLFFIVDSDDKLPKDALTKIHDLYNQIKDKENFAGFSGIRITPNGNLIGSTFKEGFIDCTALERNKYKIKGDKAEVYYTNILRKYPFPVYKGENFITESVVWYRMANDGYKIRWTNEKIYICNYLPGGLSNTTGKSTKSFKGFELTVKEQIHYDEISLFSKLKLIAAYGGICIEKRTKIKECAMKININYYLLLFFGFAGYIVKLLLKLSKLIKKRRSAI
jgi:glycosyltransferase involved in cell wall biosynthesis